MNRMGQGRRVVSVQRAAYEPPAPLAVAPPSRSLDDQGESFSQSFPWPQNVEQTIYVFQRRWQACDVYLSTRETVPVTGTFTVRVYAHTNSGLRVLVATGRLGNFQILPALTGIPSGPVWAAAARAQASFFEVTLQYNEIAVIPATGVVTVSVAASDRADPAPEWVGVMPLSLSPQPFVTTVTATQVIPSPELVQVSGVCGVGVAADRYLHVHRNRTVVVFAGLAPILSFPLGVLAGQGGVWPLSMRGDSFAIVASSTADLTTVAVDCFVNAVMR